MIRYYAEKYGVCILGALLLFCACFSHSQTTNTSYYVDCQNGSNSPLQPGTFAQPWRSPVRVGSFGASTGFGAGDAIYFKRGCVWHSGLSLQSPSGGSSGSPIVIDSYGGANLTPGTGAPPRFTGLLPIVNSACPYTSSGTVSTPTACWCQGTWSASGSNPVCTTWSYNVWSARSLFDDSSGSDNCSTDHNCAPDCPALGIHYSCLDQPLVVLNYVRFGTSQLTNGCGTCYVWGNSQEVAVNNSTAVTAALTKNNDWYFDPATSTAGGHFVQTLYVYCTCTGGVTPDAYYGQVAPIAVSNEQSPINGGISMLAIGNTGAGVQYVQVQHLLIDWYDDIGIQISGTSSSVSDHIWLANLSANSYIENGIYRYNSSGFLCGPPTNCSTTSGLAEYQQVGLWINPTWTGSGTAFTDIHAWNDDFQMNYTGIEVGGANTYACGSCVLDVKNTRSYANRTYALQDNLGGVAQISYSHFYGNNLATALETDVTSHWALPAAGITCSGGTVTSTWTANSSPPLTMQVGQSFSVATASASGTGPLPSSWSGSFTVASWSVTAGAVTLTWDVSSCPGASATGGTITVNAMNDQGNNLAYVSQLLNGTVNYSNLQMPWVEFWQRWPAYTTITYDDPGLVQYSDNYVAQVLPIAAAKVGASNFSIAVVTGGAYSGLNVNGQNNNTGFVPEIEGWLTSGYDVLTHSMSHSYWKPPASSCGTAAVYHVACSMLNALYYTGSVATSVTLTISHNATTCAGLGVSSTACFVITTSPNDPTANMALDIAPLYPWSTGASTSYATLSQLLARVNQGPFASYPTSALGTGCGYVCFDQYAGDASQALSHSLDDTY